MGLNQFTGSPWHVGQWHRNEGEKRRHRSNCVYFCKEGHYCRHDKIPCYGSANCTAYRERANEVTKKRGKVAYSASNVNKIDIELFKGHLPIGTNVRHKRFGDGMVVRYEDEFIIIHFFGFNEEKRLLLKECIKTGALIIDRY